MYEDSFYRVVRGTDPFNLEVLKDFDTEEEAYNYADQQEGEVWVTTVLSESDYWDSHPSRPIEL